ncbi:MAG: L,D-transpeptidase family protein [Acidobacteriaceae bacterium]|nr:L,D-transpeptidase family protein [Acidobacteriaceae bacterium]
MKSFLQRSGAAYAVVLTLSLIFSATGCSQSATTPTTLSGSAAAIQALTQQAQYTFLRWPEISDCQPQVQAFYAARNYEAAWTDDGKPTAAALGFVQAFTDAAKQGLNPEDYDSTRWADREKALDQKNDEVIAQFDVAMTVAVMRYISDLHMGRVNPQHFNFDINVAEKRYDLAGFVASTAIQATDVPKLVASVEPDSEPYRRLERALPQYLELARQQEQSAEPPLKAVPVRVKIGDHYAEAEQLRKRLELEGDLTRLEGDAVQKKIFDKTLSGGVRSYQRRHGLAEDGRLGPETIKSLNVPFRARVEQINNSLERWRWLPEPYLNPRLMVNLPEFALRGYAPDRTLDFTMKVVVGKVKGDHKTPVFANMMTHVIFRPYWNVPTSIIKKELVPHMTADPAYLDKHNYEVLDNRGKVLTEYTVKNVSRGGALVRMKPGPENSLGLVKFIFPNQYEIYLHSTPEVGLFNRTRRDFSHGCVRVQKAEDLAVWLLQGIKDPEAKGADWGRQQVRDAMNTGKDNRQVNLKTPIPVVIFYATAEAEPDGQIHFFDDIYGYDEDLEKVLVKGPPYPQKPEEIAPANKQGDTV